MLFNHLSAVSTLQAGAYILFRLPFVHQEADVTTHLQRNKAFTAVVLRVVLKLAQ